MAAARRVILGIGNPDRGDDALGDMVVRLLEGRAPEDIILRRDAGEATALVDCMEGAESVWMVDAAASGSPPGTIRRFDAGAGPLPSELSELSSHGLGLASAIELVRALGRLPRRCIVYAVEAEQFDAGAPLSPAVALAAETVAGCILHELASPASERGGFILHEASLMAGIMHQIGLVADAEGAVRVTGVRVWCGALSHMSRDHFAEHFEQAAAGTIAEGAALDVAVGSDPHDPRAQEVILEAVDIET